MIINSIQNTNRYNQLNRKNNKNVNFGADLKGLAGFYDKTLAKNDIFQKGVHWFSKSDKTFTHLLAIESAILSSFYMICTLTNDKIDKEQKPQMIINDSLTLGFSTAGSYLTDSKLNKFYSNYVEKYLTKNKDFYVGLAKNNNQNLYKKVGENKPLTQLLNMTQSLFKKKEQGLDISQDLEKLNKVLSSKYHLKNIIGEEGKLKAYQITKKNLADVQTGIKEAILNSDKLETAQEKVKNLTSDLYDSVGARIQADKLKKGFSKVKSLAIFGIIYRFVGPVVFTPIANKLSSKFFPNKREAKQVA